MMRFLLHRLLGAVLTLLAVAGLSFLMMRLAPGGPFDAERPLPPALQQQLTQRYGLDQLLVTQLVQYLAALAQGDLGPSLRHQDRRVAELLADGVGASLTLGALAMGLALPCGVSLGGLAARRRGGGVDRAVIVLASLGGATPSFVIAPLLTLIFALGLGWLPAGGWDGLRSAILPALALALPQIGPVARLTRATLLEALAQPHIRTARAKGLSEGATLRRHALRAAAGPVLSYLGPTLAALITGSVVVEQIFGLPGLGRHFILGALNRDYSLVLGVVMLYALAVTVANLLVDAAQAWVDPRLRGKEAT